MTFIVYNFRDYTSFECETLEDFLFVGKMSAAINVCKIIVQKIRRIEISVWSCSVRRIYFYKCKIVPRLGHKASIVG
jgi:hypothetical protein